MSSKASTTMTGVLIGAFLNNRPSMSPTGTKSSWKLCNRKGDLGVVSPLMRIMAACRQLALAIAVNKWWYGLMEDSVQRVRRLPHSSTIRYHGLLNAVLLRGQSSSHPVSRCRQHVQDCARGRPGGVHMQGILASGRSSMELQTNLKVAASTASSRVAGVDRAAAPPPNHWCYIYGLMG